MKLTNTCVAKINNTLNKKKFKKQLSNIQLYDIIAKHELSNSISEVIGAKIRFFLKNTKKW